MANSMCGGGNITNVLSNLCEILVSVYKKRGKLEKTCACAQRSH